MLSIVSNKLKKNKKTTADSQYWVPQKLPPIYAVISYICMGKVAWYYAVYICGNICHAIYVYSRDKNTN